MRNDAWQSISNMRKNHIGQIIAMELIIGWKDVRDWSVGSCIISQHSIGQLRLRVKSIIRYIMRDSCIIAWKSVRVWSVIQKSLMQNIITLKRSGYHNIEQWSRGRGTGGYNLVVDSEGGEYWQVECEGSYHWLVALQA